MLKLKAPLIIAGATCVLSMLIGLISGVRFLNILGRGLIAGVGAGSFVWCARILLERFIPDLFVPPAPSETVETADVSSGANINITLDDDLNTPTTIAGSAATTETSNTAEAHSEPHSAEAIHTDVKASDADIADAHKDEDTEFSASSSRPVDENSQGDTSLADLPNMGSFIDNDDGFDENTDSTTQTESSGFSMTGIQTGGTDSKIMAQAIRTVLATED